MSPSLPGSSPPAPRAHEQSVEVLGTTTGPRGWRAHCDFCGWSGTVHVLTDPEAYERADSERQDHITASSI